METPVVRRTIGCTPTFNFLASLINGNDIECGEHGKYSFNFLASLINGNTPAQIRVRLLFLKTFNFLASLINGNAGFLKGPIMHS